MLCIASGRDVRAVVLGFGLRRLRGGEAGKERSEELGSQAVR